MHYSSFLSFSSVLFIAIASPISTPIEHDSANAISVRDVDSKIRSTLLARAPDPPKGDQLQLPFPTAEEIVDPGENSQGTNDAPINPDGSNEPGTPTPQGPTEKRIIILGRQYNANGIPTGEYGHQIPVDNEELEEVFEKVLGQINSREKARKTAEGNGNGAGQNGQTEEFRVYQPGDDSVDPFAGFKELPSVQQKDEISKIAHALFPPALATFIIVNWPIIVDLIQSGAAAARFIPI